MQSFFGESEITIRLANVVQSLDDFFPISFSGALQNMEIEAEIYSVVPQPNSPLVSITASVADGSGEMVCINELLKQSKDEVTGEIVNFV